MKRQSCKRSRRQAGLTPGGCLTPASWELVSMSWVCCRAVWEGLSPWESGREGDISPHSSILFCEKQEELERNT